MKTLHILYLLVTHGFAFGQEWIMSGNILQKGRLDDVYFIDSLRGWTASGGGEIYKTINGGETWTTVYSSGAYLRSIEFINDSVGFAGSLQGHLLKSIDGGDSWIEIQDLIPNNLEGICGLSHIGDNVYGVGIWSYPAYFIKSTDQGLTWTYADLSEHADGLVDCHFIDENTGYLSGTNNEFGGVILKTTDAGTTWYPVFYSGLQIEYVWKLFFVNNMIAYASIESFDSSTYIAKTINNGETWTKHFVSQEALDIQGIGFIDEKKGWVGPRGSPLLETHDGGLTWNETNYMRGINRFFRSPDGVLFASGRGVHQYHGGTSSTNDQTISIREHAITDIYPNPFSAELKITIRIDNQTRVKLDIVNVDGSGTLSIYDGTLSEGLYEFELSQEDAVQLTTSCYVILRTNEGLISKKMISIQ